MGQPLTQDHVDQITLQQGRKMISDAACKGLYLEGDMLNHMPHPGAGYHTLKKAPRRAG